MSDPARRTSVLVIDDERAVRDVLVRQLQERGYRAAGASGGEAGLELARKERFDAVVCDVSMPGLGGFGALRALKRMTPSPVVIMATGYATAELASEFNSDGAYDCLPKPYPIERLIDALDRALGPGSRVERA